jgi:hypothetical protein
MYGDSRYVNSFIIDHAVRRAWWWDKVMFVIFSSRNLRTAHTPWVEVDMGWRVQVNMKHEKVVAVRRNIGEDQVRKKLK